MTHPRGPGPRAASGRGGRRRPLAHPLRLLRPGPWPPLAAAIRPPAQARGRGGAAPPAIGALLALLLLGPAASGWAKEPGVALSATEHATASRLVIALPRPLEARLEGSADAMVLRLPKGTPVDLSALGGQTPRRASAIIALPDGVRIVAGPGARLKHRREGGRIVIDLEDAPAPAPPAEPPRARQSSPPAAALAVRPAGPAPEPVAPAAVAQWAQAAPLGVPAAPRPPALRPPGPPAAGAPPLPALVQPPEPNGAPRPASAPVAVTLETGSGRLLQLPAAAATVLSADPRVLRVQPASPTSLFIMGVAAGRTNLIATGEDGTPVIEYDVTVGPGRPLPAEALPRIAGAGPALNAAGVESMIRRLVRGGAGVRVTSLGDRGLVLSGLVPGAAESQRAEAIAKTYAGEQREVLNNLGLLSAIQVNLRVRVAEISRSITRELGFNWLALTDQAASWAVGLRTGAAASLRDAIIGRQSVSDAGIARIGLRYSSSGTDVNAVIDALANDQLIAILAEPNLTAQSGETASFLAGGEFPVPVTASSLTGAIGIEFKQFGVSLGFVPTVLSPDRLNLRVRPEVSELTENGAITVPLAAGVVRIPALSVRRAETTIELGSGQSFAIAGLLSRSTTIIGSGLIGLGDLPVIGALFRSDRFRRAETELVIIVTPYLVNPVSDPQALAAPTDGFRPATDLDRIVYRRQVARGAAPTQPRLPADAGFILE